MSKSRKAGRRVNRKRFSKADICDVTLNDFANSATCTGRMKKNTLNKIVTEVKQLSLAEDDRAWDEKLEDLQPVIKDDDQEEEIEVRKTSSRKKKSTSMSDNIEDRKGIDYPIDIWFLISEHIRPEDVGSFAAICKTSLAVVSTAKFWFSLYKRYYRNVPSLPERLQPECIVRRYGLRAYVIRALHYMYPPFVNKLKPQVIFDGDPHILTKRLCVLSWSQVTCLNYIPLPMILGHTLSNVSLTLSQGLRYHRLQLSFGNGPFSSVSNNHVILDPVVNLRVLDWWNPSFPHSDGFSNSSYVNEMKQFDELDF